MADKGEARSFFDVAETLDVDATEAFCDGVVWPALEALSGTNFRDIAQPGESFSLARTTLTPEGFLRVIVSADCWHEFEIDEVTGALLNEPPTRASRAEIFVEKMQDDLTPGLKAAAFGGGVKPSDTEPEIDETLNAWQVTRYEFYSGLDPDESFHARSDFELQDETGDCIWSPDMVPVDATTDVPDDLIDSRELEDEMRRGLETGQCLEIVEALGVLGITSRWIPPKII